MLPLNRIEAQGRVDQIHAFRRELALLREEGTIALHDAQSAAIAARHAALLADYAGQYDVDRDARARQLSLGMRIASFLGALALAAAVFFLFYQFWGGLPTWLQIGIVLGAALGALTATAWLRVHDASGYFTKLAALVAVACFVLNIVVLGEVFNITPSDKALLPWAALAFLLAYRCDLRLLLVAGMLCIVAFIAARAGTWGGMYWLDFGRRPENFLPAAIVLFCLPMVFDQRRHAGFAASWRVFGLLTLLLPVLLLSNWGASSYLALPPAVIEGGYQVLGFVLSALAIWLGTRKGWPGVVNTGVTFFVIFLYTKLFDWWWELMPKYLFFLIIALSAVLLLLVFRRLRAHGHADLAGATP
jgi:uncharacterized membrane protein